MSSCPRFKKTEHWLLAITGLLGLWSVGALAGLKTMPTQFEAMGGQLNARSEQIEAQDREGRSAKIASRYSLGVSTQLNFRVQFLPLFVSYGLQKSEFESAARTTVQQQGQYRHSLNVGISPSMWIFQLRLSGGFEQAYFARRLSQSALSLEKAWVPRLTAILDLPIPLSSDLLHGSQIDVGVSARWAALFKGFPRAIQSNGGEQIGGGAFVRYNGFKFNVNYTRERHSSQLTHQYNKILECMVSFNGEF